MIAESYTVLSLASSLPAGIVFSLPAGLPLLQSLLLLLLPLLLLLLLLLL